MKIQLSHVESLLSFYKERTVFSDRIEAQSFGPGDGAIRGPSRPNRPFRRGYSANSPAKTKVQLRSHFPENWLFEMTNIEGKGFER